MSISKKQLIVTAIVAPILLIGTATGINMLLGGELNEPQPQTQEAPAVTRQDPEVVAYMQTLGIDYKNLNLIFSSEAELGKGVAGDYSLPNTIRLSKEYSEQQLRQTAAHEYLHYVQRYVDVAQATLFHDYILQLESALPSLQKRVEPYRTGEACAGVCERIEDEIEAIACTELPDSFLREDFIAWCNKHIPNRDLLFQ